MLRVEESHASVELNTVGVLVAIPAYNEDRFIGSVVLKLRGAGYAVVVVDDGSFDATADVAAAAGAEVIRHPLNRGKAAALHSVFQYARKHRAEALVVLDGDGQHDPHEVDQVAGPILTGRADMVIGSRFVGVTSRIPRWRVAGQHALTLATNLGSGTHVTDSQSGFRAFSPRAMEQMTFGRAGFSVESEMQFEAKAHGLRVVEVPIRVAYAEPNKRNPVWQGVGVVDGVLRLIAQHRPLLFFSLPGLLLMAGGLALGLYVVRIYEATLTLAIGYAILTVLLAVVGLLSTFVGIMLHTIRALLLEFASRK